MRGDVVNVSEKWTRRIRFGTAAAIGSASLATFSPLSQVASADSQPGNACLNEFGEIYQCYVVLTDNSGGVGMIGADMFGEGQCNLALYNGQSVVIGQAIYQSPKVSCEGYNVDVTGPKGVNGNWYTAAIWVNDDGPTQYGSIDDTFPFSS